jgi:wyosine [tRNA(Phe)-imidazoG37] synthetase (radical SAM superfamily)
MSNWKRPTAKEIEENIYKTIEELSEFYKDETVRMSVFVFNMNNVFTRLHKIEKRINDFEKQSGVSKSGVI